MNSFSRMLCSYLYGFLLPKTFSTYHPRLFLKFGTPRVDGCSSAIINIYIFPADSTYRPPSLYSLMFGIGCLLSTVPQAREILLEMLTIDSYWELDTVQLLKHICISGQDLVNSIRPMPIWRPFSISCVLGSQWYHHFPYQISDMELL
jgi:hypothetical protein